MEEIYKNKSTGNAIIQKRTIQKQSPLCIPFSINS